MTGMVQATAKVKILAAAILQKDFAVKYVVKRLETFSSFKMKIWHGKAHVGVKTLGTNVPLKRKKICII